MNPQEDDDDERTSLKKGSSRQSKKLSSTKVLLGFAQLSALIACCMFFGLLSGNLFYDIRDDEVSEEAEFSPATTSHHVTAKKKHTEWPRLAWLLSFPNSGTSYTSRLVRHMSQLHTASNYGEEYTDQHGESIPLYPDDPEGPFLVGDPSKYKRPSGQMYILTKTHCGGRCERCGPSDYVENAHSFERRCFAGRRTQYIPKKQKFETVDTLTSQPIYRAVHLIRNPFDNIVSRFHLQKKQNYSEIADIPDKKRGFRSFCARMMDRKYLNKEKEHRIWDTNSYKLLENVPCRSDFYRWVLWHDMAFATTRDMKIPVHVIHYESYATNFDETVDGLMEFLQIKPAGKTEKFTTGLEYKDYFTEEERRSVGLAAKELALPTTWMNIRHYFDME